MVSLVVIIALALAAKFFIWPKYVSSQKQTTTAPWVKSESQSAVSTTKGTSMESWNNIENIPDCFHLSFPPDFQLTTNDAGLSSLTAAGSALKITIQKNALPASTTFKDFILNQNTAITLDNERALPGDTTSSLLQESSLGAFMYKQQFFDPTGKLVQTFLAPSVAPDGYYTVLVWGQNNDPLTVQKILASFTPTTCQSPSP